MRKFSCWFKLGSSHAHLQLTASGGALHFLGLIDYYWLEIGSNSKGFMDLSSQWLVQVCFCDSDKFLEWRKQVLVCLTTIQASAHDTYATVSHWPEQVHVAKYKVSAEEFTREEIRESWRQNRLVVIIAPVYHSIVLLRYGWLCVPVYLSTCLFVFIYKSVESMTKLSSCI